MTIFGLPLAHSHFSFEKEGMFLSEKRRVFEDPESQTSQTMEIRAEKAKMEAMFEKNGLTTPEAKETMWKLMKAFSTQESGNNYNATGITIENGSYKGEKAIGRYQIMPSNWNIWSKEALGSVQEPTPENQDLVAAHQMSKYFSKWLRDTGGNIATSVQLTAVNWYGNRSEKLSADLSSISDEVFYIKNKKGEMVRQPSPREYAQSVLALTGDTSATLSVEKAREILLSVDWSGIESARLEFERRKDAFEGKTKKLEGVITETTKLSTQLNDEITKKPNDFSTVDFTGNTEIQTQIKLIKQELKQYFPETKTFSLSITVPSVEVKDIPAIQAMKAIPSSQEELMDAAKSILTPYTLSKDTQASFVRNIIENLIPQATETAKGNLPAFQTSLETLVRPFLQIKLTELRKTQLKNTFGNFETSIIENTSTSIKAELYAESQINKKYDTVKTTLTKLETASVTKPAKLEPQELIELLAHLKENFDIDFMDLVLGKEKGKLSLPDDKDQKTLERKVIAQKLLDKIDFSAINWDEIKDSHILKEATFHGRSTMEYVRRLENDERLLRNTLSIAQALGMEKPNGGDFTREEIAGILGKFIIFKRNPDGSESFQLTPEANRAISEYQKQEKQVKEIENAVAGNSLKLESRIDVSNASQLTALEGNIQALIDLLNKSGGNSPEKTEFLNKLTLRKTAIQKAREARVKLDASNATLEQMKIKGDFTIDRIEALMKVEADQQGKESFVKYVPAVIAEWWHGMDVNKINSNQNFHQKTMDLLSVAALQVRKERDVAKKAGDISFDEDKRLSEVSAQLFEAYNSFFVDPEKFEQFVEPALIKKQVEKGVTQEEAKKNTQSLLERIQGGISNGFSWINNQISGFLDGNTTTEMAVNPKAGEGKDDFKKIMGAFIGQADALDQFKNAVCAYGEGKIDPTQLSGFLTKNLPNGSNITFARQAEQLKSAMSNPGGQESIRLLMDQTASAPFLAALNQQIREARPLINTGGNPQLAEAYKAYQENLQSGGVAQWWDGMSGGLKLGLIALLGLAAFKHPETFVKGGLGMFGAMALTKAKTPGELVDIVTSKASRGVDKVAAAMGLTNESKWNTLQDRLRPNVQEQKAITLVERLPLENVAEVLRQGNPEQLATGNFPPAALNKLLEQATKLAGIPGTLGISTEDLSKALHKVLVARAAQNQDITGKASNFVQEGASQLQSDLATYKTNGGRAGVTFEQWINTHVTRYDSNLQDTVMYAAALAEYGVDKGSQFGQWLEKNYKDIKGKVERGAQTLKNVSFEYFSIEQNGERIWFFQAKNKNPNGNLLNDLMVKVNATGETKFYQKGVEITNYAVLEPVHEVFLYTGIATDRAWQPREITELRRDQKPLFDNAKDKQTAEGKRKYFEEYIRALNKVLAPLGEEIADADEDFSNWMLNEAYSNMTTGNAGPFEDNRAIQLFKGVKQGLIYRMYQDLNKNPDAPVAVESEIIKLVQDQLTSPEYTEVKDKLWGLWKSKTTQAEKIDNLIDLLDNDGWLNWFNNLDEKNNEEVMRSLATLGAKTEAKPFIDQFHKEMVERFANEYDLWGQDKTSGGERIYAQTIFLYQELMNNVPDGTLPADREHYAQYIKAEIFSFYATALYDKTPTSWHVNELRSGANNSLPTFAQWQNKGKPQGSPRVSPTVAPNTANQPQTDVTNILKDTTKTETQKTQEIVGKLEQEQDKNARSAILMQLPNNVLIQIQEDTAKGHDIVRDTATGNQQLMEKIREARKETMTKIVQKALDNTIFDDDEKKIFVDDVYEIVKDKKITTQQVQDLFAKVAKTYPIDKASNSWSMSKESKKDNYQNLILTELRK